MEIIKGKARTEVALRAEQVGPDWVISIHNRHAHVGAVAVGEFDAEHQSAHVSVITRRGHKDDVVAQRAAYRISRRLRTGVCVIAGIHLDDASGPEIARLVKNAASAVVTFLNSFHFGHNRSEPPL
jgi:hypothetical protein